MNELGPRNAEGAFPVVVVGAGFAGVAAAWSAARAGARVLVFESVPGASALYSGIADGDSPSLEARELGRSLGLEFGVRPAAVATREGHVRPAVGRDAALLDLESVPGARVAVVDFGRDDFDAALLAKSYARSAWAQRRRAEFVAVPVEGLERGAERRIAASDLARRFDDPERLRSLVAELRKVPPLDGIAGWLFGPWLGVETALASALAEALGRPVGEVSSPLGGTAGLRFELRRNALFEELGVQLSTRRVESVRPTGDRLELPLEVTLEGGQRLLARSVVLAVGGVAAGGIELAAPGARAARGARLSLDASVLLELDGKVFDGVSSLSGVTFQSLGLGALERLGVRVDEAGRAALARLYAAGDVVAGRPRSVLTALESGIRAGRSAVLGVPTAATA